MTSGRPPTGYVIDSTTEVNAIEDGPEMNLNELAAA